MTRARRLAALAAAGLVGLATPTLAAPAGVDGGDDWSIDDVTITAQGEALVIAGTITPPDPDGPVAQTVTDMQVSVTRATEPAVAACAVANHTEHLADGDDELPEEGPTTTPTTTPTTEPEDRSGPAAFSITLPIRCNGRYLVALVSAVADGPGPNMTDNDPEPAEPRAMGEGSVNAPPPDVRGVISNFNATNRKVAVAWQPPSGYGESNLCAATPAANHPDFAGYVVERSVGGADFSPLPNGTVQPGVVCLFDQLPPDAPLGEYRYRVRAARSGTAGLVLAAGESASIVTVSVVAPPATAPPTTAAPRPPTTARATGGGPVVAPGATAPPPPDDGTFEETLDYPEVGEEAAVLPDDADTFLDFVPSPGEGILVPFAIAECLAVWAFHLRYLARRADEGF